MSTCVLCARLSSANAAKSKLKCSKEIKEIYQRPNPCFLGEAVQQLSRVCHGFSIEFRIETSDLFFNDDMPSNRSYALRQFSEKIEAFLCEPTDSFQKFSQASAGHPIGPLEIVIFLSFE
jgi:hypothetical protein